MNGMSVMPQATHREHDADGRLVKLVLDSQPPLNAPDASPWVVAVDGSDNAMRALAHAAGLQSGRLHLVNVQHWLAKEAADTELGHRAWEATARARAWLDERGLPWRLHVIMGDPADGIVNLAQQLNAAGIVMGSRGHNAIERLLFGSVAHKVMHAFAVPVTVVP